MARKKRRSRRRGVGSVIQVRQLSGTERINNPSSVTGALVPVLLGGSVAFLTTLGVRKYVEPTQENAAILDNADLIGGGTGVLTGLVLWNVASRPAGVAAMAAAAVVSLAQLVPGWMAGAMAAPTAGLRAVVPEYSMRGTKGLRAIAMQSQASRGYGADGGGENISLGRINAGAFGTPGFRMSR
jgi:hypothetical protein